MRIIVTLFILVLSINVQALTRAQILDNVRWILSDRIQQNVYHKFQDDVLIKFINEAQREIADMTFCVKTSTSFNLTQGTTYYTLPTNYYTINRVIMDNQKIPETTLDALDTENAYWLKDSTGTPTKYYLTWDRTKIGFYYSPSDELVVQIDYVAIPNELTSDTSVPFNGLDRYVPYHKLIVYWTVAQCLMVDKKFTEATMYWNLYSNGLNNMAAQIGISLNYFPIMSGKRE